ncbi:hypothetical protein [Paractinoplanes lichenicola]|uniref:Lipoprotein n=1 Tax=Paractinoplanes lichenicola TaxID=2802976 RepID=A0ABS1VNZ4_9ACTN|nr:hypothetical protein [Actinoplanes lichenicola]MBL7255854.1 hypothetical protein [Actinoplanes lichenicola]
MRSPVRLSAALALPLAAAGCYVTEADPAPVLSSLAPSCAVTGLDAGEPVIHEPRLTGYHEVVVRAGRVESSVLQHSDPERPRITWTALKTATVDDVLRAAAQPDAGRSPGRDELAAAVAGLGAEDGTFIGYAAVRPIELRFTGTCADGGVISGYLYSWTGSEVGVVKCGTPATATARLAQSERC